MIRLFQTSWQDDKNRGTWTLPAQVENHLRKTGSKVANRRLLYGDGFLDVIHKLFERDIASLQLEAVMNLIEEGIDSFKDLSPRKLRAIQLALGLVERKLPKTLVLVKNRLEAKLAGLKAELPNNL